jgi:hypothetical protein
VCGGAGVCWNEPAKSVSDLLELFVDVIVEFADVIVGLIEFTDFRERRIPRKLPNPKPHVNRKAGTWRDWIIRAWDWIGLALLASIVGGYLWP